MPAKRTRLQKWENSLAVRIPKSFAVEAGLGEDSAVDLSVKEGILVIRPQCEEPLLLDEPLQAVTEDNLHREWDTGPAVGKEIS